MSGTTDDAGPALSPNRWYRIYVSSLGTNPSSDFAYHATSLYHSGGTKGAVFFGLPNAAQDKDYQLYLWQFVAMGDPSLNQYAVRSWGAGAAAYLAVGTGPGREGFYTDPMMKSDSIVAGDEALWTVKPWGDGTFFLFNALNGTQLHLQEDGGQTIMAAQTSIRNQQRFVFAASGLRVDDKVYSVIKLPGVTSTITASSESSSTTISTSTTATTTPSDPSLTSSTTSSPTAPATPPSTGSPSPPSDSNAIKIAFGIAVPLALLLAGILAFFLVRRKRSRSRSKHASGLDRGPVTRHAGSLPPELMASHGKSELAATYGDKSAYYAYELNADYRSAGPRGWGRPAELPS